MNKDKKMIKFFFMSFLTVMLTCVIVFTGLSIFMSRQTDKSVKDISDVYMSEVSVQFQQKFDSIISLRMVQVQGIITRTPAEEYSEETRQEMLDELCTSGEVRRFTYLGFYTDDGELETIYGDPVRLADPDNFYEVLHTNGKVTGRGFGKDEENTLLLGIEASYPMKDGGYSDALVAGVPMSYLDSSLYLNTERANVYSYIIDKNGTFVIKNPMAFRDNYFERIQQEYETFEGKTPDDYAREIKEAMNGNKEYGTYISLNGERQHIYCIPLYGESDWYLITVLSNRVLEEPLVRLDSVRTRAMIISIFIIMVPVIVFILRYAELMLHQMKILDKARKEAISANRAKSDFLSSMSHDIRTPMNAIVGMTEIALKYKSDENRVEDCLRKVQLSSKHLLGLINDVLDMSKIESGKMTLNVNAVSLRNVVEDLVNIVQPQIKARNQYFDVFVSDIDTEVVYCDALRLDQVLFNLLSNAIKFTPEEGRIDIHLYQEPSPKGEKYIRTHFWVADTGIGMSEEFQTRIFEPFLREDSEQVQNIKGTGLGMAITKSIIDLMEGTIELESSPGKGSKFHIVLDLEKGEEMEDMSLPAWNVLVVDDNEMLCTSAAANLEELGVHAEWICDGMEAIKMIEERHKKGDDYRFVLIDFKMPKMDGIQTIKEIRARIGGDIPVFLISAYSLEEIEDGIGETEIEGFIPKPLFKSTLYLRLGKYAGKKSGKPEPVHSHKVDFTGKRLLIAEDIDINWLIAQEALTSVGFTVERAENGKICVEMFEQSENRYYDAILMDIRMPVMNGYDATKAIRKLTRKDKNLPIIAMTADAFSDDVQYCLDCGMNAHIAKPLDFKELVHTLQKFIIVK